MSLHWRAFQNLSLSDCLVHLQLWGDGWQGTRTVLPHSCKHRPVFLHDTHELFKGHQCFTDLCWVTFHLHCPKTAFLKEWSLCDLLLKGSFLNFTQALQDRTVCMWGLKILHFNKLPRHTLNFEHRCLKENTSLIWEFCKFEILTTEYSLIGRVL